MTCMNTWAGVRAPTKLSRVAPQRVRGGGGCGNRSRPAVCESNSESLRLGKLEIPN